MAEIGKTLAALLKIGGGVPFVISVNVHRCSRDAKILGETIIVLDVFNSGEKCRVCH